MRAVLGVKSKVLHFSAELFICTPRFHKSHVWPLPLPGVSVKNAFFNIADARREESVYLLVGEVLKRSTFFTLLVFPSAIDSTPTRRRFKIGRHQPHR